MCRVWLVGYHTIHIQTNPSWVGEMTNGSATGRRIHNIYLYVSMQPPRNHIFTYLTNRYGVRGFCHTHTIVLSSEGHFQSLGE